MLVWVEIILEKESINGFVQIPKSILYSPRISPDGKIAYSILKGFCYKKDSCFPGIEKVAFHMGIGKNRCRKAIDELDSLGFIKKERRGLGMTNLYRITDCLPVEFQEVLPVVNQEIPPVGQ